MRQNPNCQERLEHPVRVGDLVSYIINRPGFPTKQGIVIKYGGSYRSRDVFTVLFLDGTQNSCDEHNLEVISEGR
jgi:hypothetical protein